MGAVREAGDRDTAAAGDAVRYALIAADREVAEEWCAAHPEAKLGRVDMLSTGAALYGRRFAEADGLSYVVVGALPLAVWHALTRTAYRTPPEQRARIHYWHPDEPEDNERWIRWEGFNAIPTMMRGDVGEDSDDPFATMRKMLGNLPIPPDPFAPPINLTEPEDDLTRIRLAPSSQAQFEALAETKARAHRMRCGVRVVRNDIEGGWACYPDQHIPAGQLVTEIREAI